MKCVLLLFVASLLNYDCYGHEQQDQVCFKMPPGSNTGCGCLFANNEVCLTLPHSSTRGTCNPGQCDVFKTTFDMSTPASSGTKAGDSAAMTKLQQQLDEMRTKFGLMEAKVAHLIANPGAAPMAPKPARHPRRLRASEVKSCPVGMENGNIRDNQLVASSYWNNDARFIAYNGRLKGSKAWIGDNMNRGKAPYWIQVNLDEFITFTGVITQGRLEKGPVNPDQYVTSFKLGLGDSPTTVAFVKDANGNDIIFQGNMDRTTQVTNYIPYPTRAKSIRIHVVTFNSQPAMRFEVLQQCRRSSEVKSCPVGMGSGNIKDNQLSVSSYWDNDARYNKLSGRLDQKQFINANSAGAWIGDNKGKGPPFWYQVDLDKFITFTGVITQGRASPSGNQYVTSFKLGLGDSPTTVSFLKDENGNDIIFQRTEENTEKHVRHYIPYPTRAKSIRIHVVSFNKQPALRFEVLQQCRRSTEVKSCPGGMESKLVKDNQLVASSQLAFNPRLNNNNGAGAWVGDNRKNDGRDFWVQVNLDKFYTFTGVITQGRSKKDEWVKSFKLGLGNSPSTVGFVRDENGNDIIFQGNNDRNTQVRNYIPYPMRAKSFRIQVVSFHNNPSMRFEMLKQCD